MKNFIQNESWIKVKTPTAIVAGEPVSIGDIFGIARLSAKAGEEASLSTSGLFQADKVAGEAIALGAPVYWNATTKLYTAVAAGNAWVGSATVQALAADKKVTFVLQQSGGRGVNAIASLTGGIESLTVGGTPVLALGAIIDQRDPMGRVTQFTTSGVAYAVVYGVFGIQTITGGGVTRTVSYNAQGQVSGVSNVAA